MELDVRSFTVGPFQENCLHRARARLASAALLIDPGAEPERLIAGVDVARGDDRGDPDHPHAPRPHRRGRAARRAHRRAGVLPGARAPHPRRYRRGLRRRRARAASRATRPTSCSAAASTSSSPACEIDVHLHARPQPGPPDLRVPRRTRRCSSATCSSAARSGASDLPGGDWPTLLASITDLLERYPDADRASSRATARSRRSAASAPPTRSSPSSPPGEQGRRSREGPSTSSPRTPRARAALEAAARELLEPAGYGRIETPTFEATELFSRTASARRPTSCRRRCTASTTAAGAR